MASRPAPFVTCLVCCALAACGDDSLSATPNAATDAGGVDMDEPADEDADAETPSDSDQPFAELYEQGVLRYLGAGWTPSATVEGRAGTLAHVFQGEEGPRCYTGEEFFVATRDGRRDDLMIFVQGGGFCGPTSCEAVESWPVGIPPLGILNPADGNNPAAEFDVGYIPYCDGSLFTGDADHDTDGDGTIDRSFRGLKNLSAALDLIAEKYPSPPRIFLIGNSAGGFGVHFALPLVRALYPDIPIDMVNDSGVGILSPGSMDELSAYWNAEAFFPASCDDCISEAGHLTGYHAYQLREDANVRLGYLSSRRDEVVTQSLAGLSDEEFEATLVSAAATLKEAHGDRFNSMIIDGADHTFVVRDLTREVADTSVHAWIRALLDRGDGWVSVSE